MEITIENNIPIPEPLPHIPKRLYPFDKLKVGQSFVVDKKRRGSLTASRCWYQRKHPEVKFTIRQVGELVRTWRIA